MNFLTLVSTIITAIFLLITLSYYFVLFFKKKNLGDRSVSFSMLSILIPAHNEERFIKECLISVKSSLLSIPFEVFVVDDGSSDSTSNVVNEFILSNPDFNCKLIRHSHSGKSHSLNIAFAQASGDVVAVVDADSVVDRNAFSFCVDLLSFDNVGAVTSTIKVKNNTKFIGMWLHLEQLYNSLVRSLFAKLGVNIVTPGPLSVYRVDVLRKIGGFETKGFSEDVDVAVRILKSGFFVECEQRAVSETYMPVSVKGFLRQRFRYARGWINIFGRHLKLNKSLAEIYTLPLAFFWYFQAVVMGAITLDNIISGYLNYFVSQGVYFSFSVVKFFFDWFSIVGTIQWFISVVSGATPLTIVEIIGIPASLLVYPLFLIAIFRYDKRLSWFHIIPFIFMFPFWFVLMIIYIVSLPEVFNKNQRNIWVK